MRAWKSPSELFGAASELIRSPRLCAGATEQFAAGYLEGAGEADDGFEGGEFFAAWVKSFAVWVWLFGGPSPRAPRTLSFNSDVIGTALRECSSAV